MDTISPNLPVPRAEVQLRLLSGGYLYLPMQFFVQGANPNEVRKVPSMSWLIEHESGQRVIFDLGIRKDIDAYPPAVYHRVQHIVKTEVVSDVVDGLTEINLSTSDIDTVIFSHLHYDHVGNPSTFGVKTNFVIGPGAKQLISEPSSYPQNPNSHYDARLLPIDRTTELPGSTDRDFWSQLGPFPEAHDYFKDGSLFIVNAPGHCPGHINLLVRAASKWVLLAGDTSHDIGILNGCCQTASYIDDATGDLKHAHYNPELAEKHRERVWLFGRLENVEVILAHDHSAYEGLRCRYGSCG
ncbi:hypothetical protein FE257_007849 [Aspergillus nanangensis]|uniref:Metallo-beta-lactamase domain-containing protein n=1 Tax=Aspergillus nanangensis TaxID=2582783 RepID=A0AAD4CX52_ASPNN|nr:hypothetical protein FE257_007849 [Aspergillus nanangensis]